MLREIGPEADATIAETHAELAEEAETLDRLADEALSASGAEVTGAIGRDALAELDPAIRRLVLRRLAERAPAGRCPSAGRGRRRSGGSANEPEGGVVELGGG